MNQSRGPRILAGAVAVAIIAGIVLARCGGGAGDGPVRIRFWNGFTGPDGRTMLRIVRDFNAANPDVQVTMQRMDWATYYNKVFVAGIGGRAPEVFVVHTDSLPRFQGAGLVAPLDGLLAGLPGWDPADIDETVWLSVAFDGEHYALPLDVHMLGLYYNKDAFRAAGLVDAVGEPLPPATGDEFVDALEVFAALARREGSDTEWGYALTWFRTNAYALMCQFGGAFFDASGRCVMNNAENVAALEFLVDLVHERGLAAPPANFDSWIGFRQGKVAMVFEGIYMLGDLEKQGALDFGAAALPQIGPHPATWAASHNLCLNADLSGRERDAALRFMVYLSDNSLRWAEAGQVPVRKSLRASDAFQDMGAQRAFAEQLDRIVYGPRISFSTEFWTEFDLAVEKALRGSAPPEQALREAQDRVNAVIERRGG